jgi:peptidoglycan-N-acetylglucosamine deacetylase
VVSLAAPTNRWGPALGIAVGLQGAACARADAATAPDASVDEVPVLVALPEGGRCAPAVTPASMPATEPLPDIDGGPACDSDGGAAAYGDAGAATPFGPTRPLGAGYPNEVEVLPDRVAYLSFDDGPSDWTSTFLDILKTRGAKATFFITAKQLKGESGLNGTYLEANGTIARYRDMVKREVDEGHAVGNHTVNHPDLAGITEEQIQGELDENELLVNIALLRAGGAPQLLSLFRPPYGSPWYLGLVRSADSTAVQISAGRRIATHALNVMWTIDSTDSREWAQGESFSRTQTPTVSPHAPGYEEKIARIRQTVLADPSVSQGRGIIVLMHDTHDTTRDALPSIVDGLIAAGYAFDTLEHYVQWRWSRPSFDLTPGPALYAACVDDRDWGCASFGVPGGTDRSHEVCGRMWSAFRVLGGSAVLGRPISAPTPSPGSGVVSQAFERATVELHPENRAPCNVVVIPR